MYGQSIPYTTLIDNMKKMIFSSFHIKIEILDKEIKLYIGVHCEYIIFFNSYLRNFFY